MKVYTQEEKVKAIKKCILSIFIVFSLLSLMPLSIIDDFLSLAITPILLFFSISFSIILQSLFCSNEKVINHLLEYAIIIILYSIYCSYNFIFTSVFIRVDYFFDIHFILSSIMLAFLILGLIIGSIFTKNRDITSFKKETIIRGNEIELRKFNPWADLSLDKAPWLRKPLKGLHYAVAVFILLIGGSAAGLSIAITEGLRRTDILGDEVNTYAFLFFVMGVPIGIAIGVVIAPLISYLYHWRKLLKTVKKEHGSYTVLLNLEKKPYSELKQGLSEG